MGRDFPDGGGSINGVWGTISRDRTLTSRVNVLVTALSQNENRQKKMVGLGNPGLVALWQVGS